MKGDSGWLLKQIANRYGIEQRSARPAGPRLRLHIGETQSCPIFERPYKPAIPCARSIFLKVHLEMRCPAPSTVTELEQYLMRARIEIEASGRLWNQSIQRSQSFRRFRNSASATACYCRFIDGRGNGSDCSSGGGGQRSDRPDRIRAGSVRGHPKCTTDGHFPRGQSAPLPERETPPPGPV